MTYGTAYFPTFASAVAYYEPYGIGPRDVRLKWVRQEIHLGPPPLKAGERAQLIDDGTRYAVVSP